MKNFYYNRDGSERKEIDLQMTMDDKRVAEDTVGKYWVSTVFLPFNYEWDDKKPPLIFETMVFVGKDMSTDSYQERYSTEEQAKAGHDKVVAYITKHGISPAYGDVLL